MASTARKRAPADPVPLRSVMGGLIGLMLVAVAGAGPGEARAQTLLEALATAYQTNPTLLAQREQLRSTNEQVAQALSGYRPFAQADADAGFEWTDTESTIPGAGGDETLNPASLGITVRQPIYRGGRTEADVRRAENTIFAQRAALQSTEQQVLFDASEAYMNLVRDQAVLELTINNEQVLERQLQASRDRFAVGEITRTDVSQAESRLARATADRIQAEGNLRSARATYESVIGAVPVEVRAPPPLPNLPASLDETVVLAEANNPQIIAALFNEEAADATIDLVRGELLPELNLDGEVRRSYEPSGTIDEADRAAVIARLTVPLYQSGAVSSRVREARYLAGQRRVEVNQAQRDVVELAVRSWEALTTARASIQSRVAQVQSAEIALDGVQQEAQVGARTVLDVLDAEQELLDARVALVESERDEVVASFGVLAAIGALTAIELQLPVDYYDVEQDYLETRSRWWGTSVDRP